MYCSSNLPSSKFLLILICVNLWLSVVTISFAGTPQKINYKGTLYETGVPVTGNRTITFKLYTAVTGGTELWSSGTQTVTISSGMFNYVLGSNVSLSGIDWENNSVYLELTVAGTVLSPREQLISSAYALNADMVDGKHASELGGGTTSPWTLSGNNVYYNLGNVGIGTTSPTQKLDVRGNLAVNGNLKFENPSGNPSIYTGSNGVLLLGSNAHYNPTTPYGFIADGISATVLRVGYDEPIIVYYNTGLTTGNGFTETKIFSIGGNGDVKANGNFYPGNQTARYIYDNNVVGNYGTRFSSAVLVDGTLTASKFVGDGSGLTGITGSGQWTNTTGGIYYTGGNVGIGTTSPASKLVVKQDGSNWQKVASFYNTTTDGLPYIQIGYNDSSTTDGIMIGYTNKSPLGVNYGWITHGGINPTTGQGIILKSDGNVGIGTTSPAEKLHIEGGNLRLGERRQQDDLSTLDFFPYGSGINQSVWQINAVGSGTFRIHQWYNSAGTQVATDRLAIDNTGNVGIGTISPTAKLHVVGNIYKTGSVSFVQDHPSDSSLEIVYVCLEGGETGTYVRGEAQLTNGQTQITLPEHFTLVTAETGLTAQVTPIVECNGLKITELSNSKLLIQELNSGSSSAKFYYLVNGIRKGYENYQPIKNK